MENAENTNHKSIEEDYEIREAIEGIKRGLEAMKAGRTKPAQEVHEEMRKKYGIDRSE